MAILLDKRQKAAFEMFPIIPSLDGPCNAYAVTIREEGRLLIERQYTTIKSSPDGHWMIWRLARAFMAASSLMDKRTHINVTGRRRAGFNEPVKLEVNTGWLTAILWDDTLVHRHGLPSPISDPRFWVQLYLLDKRVSGRRLLPSYNEFGLLCHPEEVVAFGNDLLRECRAAKEMRLELGIPAPADDYIDD